MERWINVAEVETRSPFGSFAPIFWRPIQELWVDSNASLLHRLSMVIDDVFSDADDVLAFVVVNQVERAERWDDIVFFDAGQFADLTKMLNKVNKSWK